VGCDGGRSLVRKAAGIEFAGSDASTSWMIAEVEMDDPPEPGITRDSVGQHAIGRRSPDDPVRVVLTERQVDRGEHVGEPSMDDLRDALVSVYGTDHGLRSASWISRFTDLTRQAVAYRQGRVLLAGDAAHVHPPHGGQGLNTGVQDAVNLGWKLAQVIDGTSPESLLDTYHAERHPVGARVLRTTMAQVALSSPDDRHQALRDTVADLLAMDEPRRRIAGMMSGLDIRYDPRPAPTPARRTRSSGGACPTSTSAPPTGPPGCSRSSTRHGPCCSRSWQVAVSTSRRGAIGSVSSTRPTTQTTTRRGSCR
jgi:3-(3-hydroxy-phenyl)propionate hydroxylase